MTQRVKEEVVDESVGKVEHELAVSDRTGQERTEKEMTGQDQNEKEHTRRRLVLARPTALRVKRAIMACGDLE